MSKANVETIIRNEALEVIKNAIGQHYDLANEQICVVSASEIAIPIVDVNGDDAWALIKVSIPRGTRNGTGGYNPYDGYAAAEDYQMTLDTRAAKKAASEAKKAAKIKADEAKRAAKKKVAAKDEDDSHQYLPHEIAI